MVAAEHRACPLHRPPLGVATGPGHQQDRQPGVHAEQIRLNRVGQRRFHHVLDGGEGDPEGLVQGSVQRPAAGQFSGQIRQRSGAAVRRMLRVRDGNAFNLRVRQPEESLREVQPRSRRLQMARRPDAYGTTAEETAWPESTSRLTYDSSADRNTSKGAPF